MEAKEDRKVLQDGNEKSAISQHQAPSGYEVKNEGGPWLI
jgi:hypothetical protein